jgi:hypothetical protein
MDRINRAAKTGITVFHTFHDEVDVHRQHWWQCSGPCTATPPFFGLVKRSMNRPPGKTSTCAHQCADGSLAVGVMRGRAERLVVCSASG